MTSIQIVRFILACVTFILGTSSLVISIIALKNSDSDKSVQKAIEESKKHEQEVWDMINEMQRNRGE